MIEFKTWEMGVFIFGYGCHWTLFLLPASCVTLERFLDPKSWQDSLLSALHAQPDLNNHDFPYLSARK